METADRLARLESTYEGFKEDLRHLATTIDRLSDKVATFGRPNWVAIIGSAGLAFTIATGIASTVGLIGGLALLNVRQNVEANMTQIEKDEEAHSRRFDELEAAVSRLDERIDELRMAPHAR